MVENQNGSPKSAPFGALDAGITPETTGFFVSDADGDPDCPTKGFASIEQAVNTLKEGKVITFICPYPSHVDFKIVFYVLHYF